MEKEFTSKEVIDYLKKLDDSVDYPVTLILMGGTALGLLDNKPHSEDIDITYLIPGKEKKDFLEKVVKNAEKRGISPSKVHIFSKDEAITLTCIADFSTRAIVYKNIKFKHLVIKIMNIYDIILTKVKRFEGRDLVDLKNILKKIEISEPLLDRRFSILLQNEFQKELFIKHYQKFKELYGSFLKK